MILVFEPTITTYQHGTTNRKQYKDLLKFDAHHKNGLRPYACYDTVHVTPLFFSCDAMFIGRSNVFLVLQKPRSISLVFLLISCVSFT